MSLTARTSRLLRFAEGLGLGVHPEVVWERWFMSPAAFHDRSVLMPKS